MFASSYTPYISQRDGPSARDRYVSALSRARQAEAEYAAYLVRQARERAELARRRREEQARAAAVRRLQVYILHAAVSSLLEAQHEVQMNSNVPQAVAHREPPKPAPTPDRPQLQRRNRVRVVRAPDAPLEQPVRAVRNALKQRLASEPSVEVHDTIHRILSNLPAASKPAAARPTRVIPPSLATVQNIERAFHALASEFVFPPHLDFTATPAAADYPASQLPYTPRNAPVRHYEHALNSLLAQLDSIESQGDAAVRLQRKLVVGMVEAALEELDRVVEGRWKLQDTRPEPRARTALPAEPANLPSTSGPAASSSGNTTSIPVSEPNEPQPEQPSPSDLDTTAIPVSEVREPHLEPSQLPSPSELDTTSISVSEDKEPELKSAQLPSPSGLDTTPIQVSGSKEPEPEQLPLETNATPVDESFQLPPPLSADKHQPITPATADASELSSSNVESVDAPVLASPSSPKSLSLVTALPDEELVFIDSEQGDDNDSNSSWSEIED